MRNLLISITTLTVPSSGTAGHPIVYDGTAPTSTRTVLTNAAAEFDHDGFAVFVLNVVAYSCITILIVDL